MASKIAFALAALAGTVLAQDTQTTLTVPLGEVGGEGFVASIQAAEACDTTVIVECASTSSPNSLCLRTPDLTATAVIGPTGYELQIPFNTLGASGFLSESCAIEGPATDPTSGVCTGVFSIALRGTSTASTVTYTAGQGSLGYAPVAVTAGVSNLPSEGATCTATADLGSESESVAPSETSDGGAAATNVVVSVVKVLVPVAAVAGALM